MEEEEAQNQGLSRSVFFFLLYNKCLNGLCYFLLPAILEPIMLILPSKKFKGNYNWGPMMISLGLLFKHLNTIQIWPPSFL